MRGLLSVCHCEPVTDVAGVAISLSITHCRAGLAPAMIGKES